MASLNRVTLIGRVGADPETRYTQGGQAVCRFRLATSSSYTDRSGQRVEQTEWHSIVTFGKTADVCGQYLHKGSLAYVEGSLTTRKWQDKNGQERFTTEIKADRVQFLEKTKNEPERGAEREKTYDDGGAGDEDIPF